MKLHYKAITKEGKTVQGVIEATDINQAAGYLISKEFIPIQILNIKSSSFLEFLEFIPIFKGRVTGKDILLFTRQLSSMLASGLTLIRSLEILKNQISKGKMAEVIDGIINGIQAGESFSVSLSKYPNIFSPVYVSMIRASESSGLLDKALLRFTENLEKQQKLKSTVKAALLYPAIVVIGMIAVVVIMAIFVIPAISGLFKSLPNVVLPLPTRIVIGVSDVTIKFWPFLVPLPIVFLFFLNRFHKSEAGRLILDSLILKLPVFGPLIKKVILTEFARTLGLMVGTGTLVVQSLIQAADTTGNIHYKNAISDIAKKVEKGLTVSDAMERYNLFPPVLIQLVKVGEQTGKMDETLLKASEYFEEEVDQAVKTLTTAMEPIIMIVLGIGVAFLIVSILLPIYSLVSAF